MKLSLYVDQCTLEHWKGKIDATDCLIMAFVADLNPDNPALKKRMWRGHFLVKLSWLQDQLPILDLSDSTLYRRLVKLTKLGLLSKIKKKLIGAETVSFFKLGDLYWKIHDKRHQVASKAAEKQGEQPVDKQDSTLANDDETACTGANAMDSSSMNTFPPTERTPDAAALLGQSAEPASTDSDGQLSQPKRDSMGIVPQGRASQAPDEELGPEDARADMMRRFDGWKGHRPWEKPPKEKTAV